MLLEDCTELFNSSSKARESTWISLIVSWNGCVVPELDAGERVSLAGLTPVRAQRSLSISVGVLGVSND